MEGRSTRNDFCEKHTLEKHKAEGLIPLAASTECSEGRETWQICTTSSNRSPLILKSYDSVMTHLLQIDSIHLQQMFPACINDTDSSFIHGHLVRRIQFHNPHVTL